MKGILGFVIALVLLVVLFSWLKIEGSKLLTPNIRSMFGGSTSTSQEVSDSSSGDADPSVSPYVGRVVISAINLAPYASVSIQNNGVAQIPLSSWKLHTEDGTLVVPRGTPRSNVGGTPTPVLLAAGETAVIFEGVRNEQAISVKPNAHWYAWTGTQFLKNKDTIILYDERGREVATFSY